MRTMQFSAVYRKDYAHCSFFSEEGGSLEKKMESQGHPNMSSNLFKGIKKLFFIYSEN